MDCRKAWVLAVLLLTGGVGCLQTTAPQTVDTRKDADQAQRPPLSKKSTANLTLADGRLLESTANAAATPPPLQTKMREQARQAYRKVLDLDPKNLDAELALARLAVADGNDEQARRYFTLVTQDHPKEAAVWYQLGMYHGKRKEWQPSVDALQRANQLEPDNREVATKLGLTLARSGQTDQGVACLAKVMGNAQAHYNVARMLAHMNQLEQSKQHLQQALRYKADLQPARELLAQLEGGRPEGARGVVTVDFQTPAQE
jgi:tetratricopeptide (TPR) repeat protein